MGRYLLIESRDPFECQEVLHDWDLAESLASAGNSVTLFLVQNGVLPARKGSQYASRLTQLANGRVPLCSRLAAGLGIKDRLPAQGPGNHPGAEEGHASSGGSSAAPGDTPAETCSVTILADDFSLRERGIRDLTQSVEVKSLEELLDLLLVPETRALWH